MQGIRHNETHLKALDSWCSPRIPPIIADSFTNDYDAGKLPALLDSVEKFNSQYANQLAPQTSSAVGTPASTATGASSGAAAQSPARTMCRPAFGNGDRPLDFSQTLLPSLILPMSEFDSSKEFLGPGHAK